MYENINNAASGQWYCIFNKLQGTVFKLQNFTMPNISANPTTPLGQVGNLQLTVAGDHIEYEPLQLDFLVDSNYKNYLDILKWMLSNSKSNTETLDDCTIYITKTTPHTNMLPDSNGVLTGLSFTFTDCYPINLQSIPLDSVAATKDLQCSVTLQFYDMCVNECC